MRSKTFKVPASVPARSYRIPAGNAAGSHLIAVSEAWLPLVLGLFHNLKNPEIWDGDETQQYNAAQEIEALLNNV